MLGIEFRASTMLGNHSHIELQMLANFSILKRYRQPRYGSGILPVLDQEPILSNCLYQRYAPGTQGKAGPPHCKELR